MSSEKISIIVPVHNASGFIDKCVASLTVQTYQNIEIILVENGSTDNSYSLCMQWQQKDNRIKLLRLSAGNVSRARNAGLKAMSGQYFMFVDADDYIDSTMCAKMFNAAITNNADMTFCQLANVMKDGAVETVVENGLKEFMVDNRVDRWFDADMRHGVWRILFLTEKFVDVSFDEAVNIHEDHLFFFQAKIKCGKCCFVDEPLYFYKYNYDLAYYQTQKYYKPDSIVVYKHYALGLKDFFEHYKKYFLSRVYQYRALMELELMILYNEKKFKKKIRDLVQDDYWRTVDNRIFYRDFLNYKPLRTKTRVGYFLLRHHFFALYKVFKNW